MADYSVNISNSLSLFGLADTNKWNVYNWNAFTWGEGNVDMETRVTKVIDVGSISLDSDLTAEMQFVVSLAETLGVSGDLSSETLADAAGYNYVFPDRTIDGEARDFTTWTAGAESTTAWSSAAASSTTWSEP